MIVIVIATVLVVGAIAVGVAIGLQANTSTFDPQRTPANTEDCQQTCEVFQTRQSERCTADKIAADAEAYAKSLRELLQVVAVASIGAAGVIIAAALGAIAGLAAALGPVVVGLIVVGAILVGAVLALVLIALGAAAFTANVVAGQKRQEATEAALRQTQARLDLLASCSPEDVEACLALPSPC